METETPPRAPHEIERDLEATDRRRAALFREAHARGRAASAEAGEALHLAILLKEYGATECARAAFARLGRLHPGRADIVYEQAQFHRHVGDHDSAFDTIEAALQRGVANGGIVADLAIASELDALGADDVRRARNLLDHALEIEGSDYGRASIAHLRRRGAAFRQALAAPRPMLGPAAAWRDAARAIAARRPFCLLRLGDGEGAFLGDPAEETVHEAPMHRAHRAFWAARWYGRRDAGEIASLHVEGRALRARLAEADLLGAPPWSWIAHERKYRNLRALACCLEAASAASAARVKLVATSLPTDWHSRGMVASLLARAGTVDLVTCHAGLADILPAKLGIRIRRLMAVPPPSSDAAAFGGSGSLAEPALHSAVMAELATTRPGDVVAIGAGFLGKRMALAVKAQGGIALDLGAIFDLMAGFRTRPGFRDLDQWPRTRRARGSSDLR